MPAASGWSRLVSSQKLRASMVVWWIAGICFSTVPVLLIRDSLGASDWELLEVGALAWGVAVSVALLFALPLLLNESGKAIDDFGIPNGLSALRAYAIAPLLIFATGPLPKPLGFWLFVTFGFLAGIFDLLDGIAARLFGPITKLGKALDPAVDMVFFFVVAIGALSLGVITWWLATLIGLRYLIPVLGTPIVMATGRRPEIVHTEAGRVSTMTVALVFICAFGAKILGWDQNLVCLTAAAFVAITELIYFRSLLARLAETPSVSKA